MSHDHTTEIEYCKQYYKDNVGKKKREGITMGRDIDFALMLKVLHDRGYSLTDISRKTNTGMSTLSAVKEETAEPPIRWYEAINIVDYWMRATGENPPRVGDHIDIRKYVDEN